MAIKRTRGKRTRENKLNPHYSFLVSWQPSKAGVKGELKSVTNKLSHKVSMIKSADILAQAASTEAIKKDIFKSLILISLILILELVVYLARNKFMFI